MAEQGTTYRIGARAEPGDTPGAVVIHADDAARRAIVLALEAQAERQSPPPLGAACAELAQIIDNGAYGVEYG